MSDPFSVAAGAAGILSLGIQACNGIISYYESWSTSSEDIEAVLTKLRHLRGILQHLETMSNTNTISPAIAAQITDSLLACKDAITRLDKLVYRFQASAQPSTLSGKLNAHAKRALYPFRKQTLMDTVYLLEGLQLNLNTVLNVANFSQGSEVLSQVTQLTKNTQDFSKLITRINTQETTVARLGPGGLIAKPAYFRMLHDAQETLEQASEARQKALAGATCQCSSLFPSSGGGRNCRIRARPQRHLRSCMSYSAGRESEVISRKLRYSSTMLGVSLTVMVQMNRGAGGSSISSSLHFCGIFDRNSPVVGIICDLGLPGKLEEVILKLRDIFSTHKARPTDIDHYGGGLLHLTFFLASGIFAADAAPIHRLISFLLESGTRADTISTEGRSPLDALLCMAGSERNWKLYVPVILELIDHGGFITDYALSPHNKEPTQLILLNHDEACYMSDLARCMILESADGLQSLLASGYCSANDLLGDGYSPIELAKGWPEGIKILLDAGADVRKPSRRQMQATFPLDWAIGWNCTSSVKLILDAGAPLTARALSRSTNDSMERVLIRELVARRRKLQVLGRTYLSLEEQRDMGLLDDSLPDFNATAIFKILQSRGVSTELTLDPREWRQVYSGRDIVGYNVPFPVDSAETVYHCRELTRAQMQKLYDAGFHDCHSRNEFGHTPLDCYGYRHYPIESTDRALWLFSKIRNPNFQFQDDDLPRLRALILRLLDAHPWTSIKWRTFADTEQFAFLRKVLTAELADGCSCACSPNGCTVISTASKYTLSSPRVPGREHQTQSALEALMAFTNNTKSFCHAFIRSLTFHDLEITHTCCSSRLPFSGPFIPHDPEDAKHIRWEEEDLLSELEELLSRFQAAYDQLNLPLAKFIKGYWSREMKNHLFQRRPALAENSQACKELGVYLEPSVSPALRYICIMLQPVEEQEEEE